MATVAFFSDVHANGAALEAILSDLEDRRPDYTYCLGDLVGYGPDPNQVVERVRMTGIPCILGNYDDGVAFERGSCGCFYSSPKAEAIGQASYVFTVSTLTPSNKAWLRELPRALLVTHGNILIHLVHGSPRRINEYLSQDRDVRTYHRLAESESATVLAFGHTHEFWYKSINGVLFINVGSVGWPKDGDPRAGYTILRVPELVVEQVRVSYEVELTASRILKAKLPAELAGAIETGSPLE